MTYKYRAGSIDPLPNECGIFTGEIDLPSKDWFGKVVVYGNSTEEVTSLVNRVTDSLNRADVPEKLPNYAAAFNAWMDNYVNDPQAYENSHHSAVRHLKEKLSGEEPSYGEVCAEVLVNYLNKLESK